MSILVSTTTNWAALMSISLIFLGFILLLVKHPFDPEHIAMSIDDQEAIVILKDDDVYSATNNSDLNPIILSNPLETEQCQNALIRKYKISKKDFISQYYNDTLYKKCKRSRIWDFSGIWSMEYLHAMAAQNCFIPRLMLRTSLRQQSSDTTNPVFYHIPKSASSSTATMTTDYFDFGSKWVTRTAIARNPYNHTKCGFTFVRDPIKRFISGYYTINAMIFGENQLNFTNHSNPKYDQYKFIKIMGEPQRFESFVDELIANPFLFYSAVPFRHISSQTYFLSAFYGSNIDFIGKVENYNKHWIALLNYEKCAEWFRNETNIKRPQSTNIESVVQGMYHHGFDVSFYGKGQKRSKYKEYIEALAMDAMIDNHYNLPPIYHRMTKRIYDKIVDFYYQDFVCFGYGHDYAQFRDYVRLKDGGKF